MPAAEKYIAISDTATLEKIDALNKSAFEKRNADPQLSFESANQALQLSEEVRYLKGKAGALCNLGFYHLQIAEHEKSLALLLEAMTLFEEINDEEGIAASQYNFAALQIRFGNFNIALDALHRCIAIREKRNDKAGLASCYFQLVYINEMFGNYDEGLAVGEKALLIRKELNDRIGLAATMTQMGCIYRKKKEFARAKELMEQSMELRTLQDELRGYFATLFQWIELHIDTHELDVADKFSQIGLKAATGAKEWFGVMRFNQQCGKIALLRKQIERADLYFVEALRVAEERKFKSITYELCESLSELHVLRGDYKAALEQYRKFHALKEEVLSSQSSSQLKSVQLMNEIESSRREAELERIKNIDLKNAYETIEEKNKDITDSILYAQRIQQAIIPTEEEFRKLLPQSFVLFKPRDIVSGDFYWITEANGKIIFAAVDCTGHGVPGAFMSMIGTTLLNEIVNEKNITQPSEILSHLRESVVRSLRQTGAEGENKDGSISGTSVQDGMDIALVSLEAGTEIPGKIILEYSGAHNPLWIFKRSGEFMELSPDKQPIGIYLDEFRPFTNHKIELEEGDFVYIFTDGYADQFGGPKGKKFKYKQLGDKLKVIRDQSMQEQKIILDKIFDDWKGELAQVDDVCVIGIKI